MVNLENQFGDLISYQLNKLKQGEKIKYEFEIKTEDRVAKLVFECEKVSENHIKCGFVMNGIE